MTIIAGKCVERQMNLLDAEEWREQNPTVKGVDVFDSVTGKVCEMWLSDCTEERVLTSQLLAEVAELSNLETDMPQSDFQWWLCRSGRHDNRAASRVVQP